MKGKLKWVNEEIKNSVIDKVISQERKEIRKDMKEQQWMMCMDTTSRSFKLRVAKQKIQIKSEWYTAKVIFVR